jgi:hypothetical protein
LVDRIIVGPDGDFKELKPAVDWFNASATTPIEIVVDGGDNLISDTVVVNNSTYNLAIRGLATDVTTLAAASGLTNKPMFDIRSTCYFTHLNITGSTLNNYGTLSTEIGMLFSQTSQLYSEVVDVQMNTFYTGISDQIGTSFFLFNFIIDVCTTGYEVNYTTTGIGHQVSDFEVGNFSNCTTAISLTRSGVGQAHGFQFMSMIFITVSGSVGIAYNPTNFTYLHNQANIINSTYNEVGTFLSGSDFTLQRDADIVVQNNVGTESKLPHAKIIVLNNATTTTVTTAGIYYKCRFTNNFTYTCKLGLSAGMMTYYPTYPYDLSSFISGNVSCNNNNRNITVVLRRSLLYIVSVTGNGATVTVTTTYPHNLQTGIIVQMLGWTGGTGVWNITTSVTVVSTTVFTYASTGNGTATGGTIGVMLSEITVRTITAGQVYTFSLNTYLESVRLYETLQPYVTSANAGDVVIISDLQWLVKP